MHSVLLFGICTQKLKLIISDYLESIPAHYLRELQNLITRCVSQRPHLRPSTAEAAETLLPLVTLYHKDFQSMAPAELVGSGGRTASMYTANPKATYLVGGGNEPRSTASIISGQAEAILETLLAH